MLWLRSPRGQRLLADEEHELRRVLPELFGRSLLQIGTWGRGDRLIATAEMLHHAVVGTVSRLGAQTLAQPEALPILSKSVDAVLLPHTLEFAHSPHDVLREVDRILTDRGRLLILGFNPWSLWGLRQRLGMRYRAFPAGARFHSLSRVCDWLELLGYEVTLARRYGVGFPWSEARSVGEPTSLRSLLGPLMEAYLVVAKKRVIPLSVIRHPLRSQVRPLIGAVSLPGARSIAERNSTPQSE
jgi:SAM-dependent methyltransferase